MPKLVAAPKRDRGRKMLRIDRRYRGVGHIRVSSGIRDRTTYQRLLVMFEELHTMPERWHLLKAISRHELTPMQLYAFYKTEQLGQAPTVTSVVRLHPHMFDWLADSGLADRTRRVYGEQFKLLLRGAHDAMRVMDLYELLVAYRARCRAPERGTHRSFNLCRAAVLSYLHSAFRDQRALWHEIVEHIPPLSRPARRRPPRHLTPHSVRALLPALSRKYREVVWTLYTTGMRISEYREEDRKRWHVLADRVHVAGTKTVAANRDIPLIDSPVRHKIHMRSFAQIMSAATSGAFQPRDLRRSYARLLADAGIPEYRQAVYMGHAVHTMTAHYQVGDVTGYLMDDAARLSAALDRG